MCIWDTHSLFADLSFLPPSVAAFGLHMHCVLGSRGRRTEDLFLWLWLGKKSLSLQVLRHRHRFSCPCPLASLEMLVTGGVAKCPGAGWAGVQQGVVEKLPSWFGSLFPGSTTCVNSHPALQWLCEKGFNPGGLTAGSFGCAGG